MSTLNKKNISDVGNPKHLHLNFLYKRKRKQTKKKKKKAVV